MLSLMGVLDLLTMGLFCLNVSKELFNSSMTILRAFYFTENMEQGLMPFYLGLPVLDLLEESPFSNFYMPLSVKSPDLSILCCFENDDSLYARLVFYVTRKTCFFLPGSIFYYVGYY